MAMGGRKHARTYRGNATSTRVYCNPGRVEAGRSYSIEPASSSTRINATPAAGSLVDKYFRSMAMLCMKDEFNMHELIHSSLHRMMNVLPIIMDQPGWVPIRPAWQHCPRKRACRRLQRKWRDGEHQFPSNTSNFLLYRQRSSHCS